jgi:hypothetical protein
MGVALATGAALATSAGAATGAAAGACAHALEVISSTNSTPNHPTTALANPSGLNPSGLIPSGLDPSGLNPSDPRPSACNSGRNIVILPGTVFISASSLDRRSCSTARDCKNCRSSSSFSRCEQHSFKAAI